MSTQVRFLGMRKKISKVGWVLDAEVLAELRKCLDCKLAPVVYLTAKKVPCCRLHWDKFADGMGVAAVDVEVPKVSEVSEEVRS